MDAQRLCVWRDKNGHILSLLESSLEWWDQAPQNVIQTRFTSRNQAQYIDFVGDKLNSNMKSKMPFDWRIALFDPTSKKFLIHLFEVTTSSHFANKFVFWHLSACKNIHFFHSKGEIFYTFCDS